MRAYVLDSYKGPLRLADVPDPEVGPYDVLVRICAAGVNPLDAKIRDGAFTLLLPYRLPLVMGHDLAGVVLRVGAGVTRFAVGDEVFGRPDKDRIGTFAEVISVAEGDLAHKPKILTMAEAASVPLVALTAWQALVERAGVGPGQKVLVHAGSGGVGTIAVQLAKHLGAHVATTTGTGNVDWVRGLGADVVIDHRTQSFQDVVRGYDVVLDTQGGAVLRRSLAVLRPGGQVVGVAGPPDPAFARDLGAGPVLRTAMVALSARTRWAARRRGVRYSFLFMRADGGQLQTISDLFDTGSLRPVLDGVFPFEELPAALARVESGRAKGKVVLAIG
jgi:NADPH:quinone reductase-like Zn-dependent oxidoreductase